MAIPGLTQIGECINPGFASSRCLLEARDLPGLQRLAVEQRDRGADWLTVNVGPGSEADPSFMCAVIRAVQEAVDLPLSIDSPDARVQQACLAAYDPARADGRPAILNSVTELRWPMFDLRRQHGCKVMFMVSERCEDGRPVANRSVEEVHATARRMVLGALDEDADLVPDDVIVDVSVNPLASDTENLTAIAVNAIRAIGEDRDLAGIHQSVGLSNLTIMLPKKAADGSPLKVALESAFLTETVPHGLDWVLGTPGRGYRLLEDGDFVLEGFRKVIAAEGFDGLMALRELYAA